MKTLLAVSACVFLIAITTILYSCKIYYKPEKIQYDVQATSEQVKHGKHMTQLMCSPCHYNEKTKKLTGVRLEDVPGFVGNIYSKNITRHPEKGIGTYTDAELAYLIRTGIARNGKLMPFMQRPNLADEDLKAIIAFLKSDDELVAADVTDPGKTKYTAMGRMGVSKAKPAPVPTSVITKPNASEKIALGKYLVDNLSCYDCHSKSFMSLNKTIPEKSKGYMGGGNKMRDKNGKTVRSRNLTPHETGIGSWTEDDFKKALRNGISKDNSIIAYPMPSYPDLTDDEISAIFTYLKSIPPIKNKIEKRK